MARPETQDPHDGAPGPERTRPGAISALLEELVRSPDAGVRAERRLRPGAVLGRFEILREVGRGGFGAVYEARDATLGRTVAVKVLATDARPASPEERLLREAEAAARLSHPNIVTLHDVGGSEHGPYLVMELLRGRSLAERLAQGPITPREALRIAVEVAKGLAHAHASGVVHRDLAPGNVYLCDDGQVKVLDFGMAHAFGRRTLDGGTPAYMAPEQWRGAPEDERTDVFTLGVILYRMLADEVPFAQEGEKPAPFSLPAPALEWREMPALGPLVDRMLDRDPVKRPRDAGEVLSALTSFEQELARAPLTGAPLPVRKRRRWARCASLLAEIGVLVRAGAAGNVVHRRGQAPAPAGALAVIPPHAAAFLIRLAVSALVIMLAVGCVTPGNPRNTFWNAVVISVLLSAAWHLTLARFLRFRLLPWLAYAAIWLVTVTVAYEVGFLSALLLAVALTLLSWVFARLLGIRTL